MDIVTFKQRVESSILKCQGHIDEWMLEAGKELDGEEQEDSEAEDPHLIRFQF